MMHSSAGPYRYHGPSQSPPPPMSQMPLNPSSSSTLSALAPPFTLDQPFPSPPPPSQLPAHLPSHPFPVADRPPPTRLPLHATAAGSLHSQPSTGSLVDPYYARYYSNSQARAYDDSFGSSSSFFRVDCDPWTFDEEVGRGYRADAVSSWTEPSLSYKVPTFQEDHTTDGRSYYDNDSYGVWNGKFTVSPIGTANFGSKSSEWLQDKHLKNYEQNMTSSYTVCSAPFSQPSALLDGVHCPGIVGSTSGMKEHDTFVPNSTYDRYMAQLDSCSVNPLVFYPSATCSSSSQVFSPSNYKATPNINSTMSFATDHRDAPFKINNSVVITSRSKEPYLNQNRIKGGYDEKKQKNYNTAKGITKNTLPLSDDAKDCISSAVESPCNPSVGLNSELRLKNVVIAVASPSRCSSMEPDKSIKSSSEVLDQHNLAVDSPCWKGAPPSRQSPFTVDEMLVTKTSSKESKDGNDPCEDGKHLHENVGTSQSSAKQVGSLNLDAYKKCPFSKAPPCMPVFLSSLSQKPESADKELSDYRTDDHENDILCEDALKFCSPSKKPPCWPVFLTSLSQKPESADGELSDYRKDDHENGNLCKDAQNSCVSREPPCSPVFSSSLHKNPQSDNELSDYRKDDHEYGVLCDDAQNSSCLSKEPQCLPDYTSISCQNPQSAKKELSDYTKGYCENGLSCDDAQTFCHLSKEPQCFPIISSNVHRNPQSAGKELSDDLKDDHENGISCDDAQNLGCLSKEPQYLSVFSSSSHQNPASADKKLSDYRKDDHESGTLCDDAHGKQINETIEVAKRGSEAQSIGSANFVKRENTEANHSPAAKGIDDNYKGACSSPQKNIKFLVKAMHSHSVDLLSNFNNEDDLEPHDYRLLYSVINNIALVLGDRKDFLGFSHCSGSDAARSCNICSTNENLNQSNMNQTHNTKGKMCSTQCNVVNDIVKYDNFCIKSSDTENIRKFSYTTQTFESALPEISEGDKDAQTYKKLWMEAEAATCRLKYELQLAQMKIGSDNLKPSLSDISSSLPFAHDLEGQNSPPKAKRTLLHTISPSSAERIRSENQPDAYASSNYERNKSDMARLKILQDRTISSNYRSMEEEILGPEDPLFFPGTIANAKNNSEKNEQDVSASSDHECNKSEDIKSSVMDRLKILQARTISSNCRSMEDEEILGPEDAPIFSSTNTNVHCSAEAENNYENNDLLENLADLGFMESFAQTIAKEKPSSSCWSLFRNLQPHDVTTDELGQCSNISGYADTNQMLSGPLNGSLIQSYMTYMQGNWPHGHEISSFEWEHVPREEPTQYP